MGSTFRVPIAARQPIDATLIAIRQRGVRTLATVAHDGTPLPECDLRGPHAIVLGAEGAGLPEAVLARCDGRLSIPMRAPVESLNVSIAAALVIYEASRQRHIRRKPSQMSSRRSIPRPRQRSGR